MRIGNRLFPYPLLNHEPLYSQYKDESFSLYLNGYIADKQWYVLDYVRIETTSNFLRELVSDGSAKLVCVVECPQTMYRKTFPISFTPQKIRIPLYDLSGKTSIKAYAIATKDIENFKSNEFLDDYNEYEFQVEKNDVIAVDEGMIARIDFDDEEDTKKSSIFLIIKDNTILDETMRVEYDFSKITISLPSQQWDLYEKNKRIKQLENMYFSIIAIPALTQCVMALQKPDNSIDRLCLDYKWFCSFKKQYETINECELTDELFQKMDVMVESQKILNTPTTKSIDDIFNLFVMKEDIGGSEND